MVRVTGGRDSHAGTLPTTHNVLPVHSVPTARLPAHLEEHQEKGQEHQQLAALNMALATQGLLRAPL